MSGGQHVGRLADSIDNEGGSRARLARTMKPAGREYHGTGGTTGNGDPCPVEGHGRMYVSLTNPNRQYCPNQSHDDERMRPNA